MRLGGAYELVHLAEDIEHFRGTVLDILCSHIRRTTGEPAYQEQHRDKPSEEVQSLLTLLFVQKIEIFKDHKAVLTGSWLIGAKLSSVRLQGADLVGVQLQWANLMGSQLQWADLSGAKLHGAILIHAQLQEADLSGAQLQGATLNGAQLQCADLKGAQLQGADLSGVQLQGAYLSRAWLQGAYLSSARLQCADLSRAQLQGAYLSRTQLQGATLWSAQLQGADTDSKLPVIFEERIKSRIGQDSDLGGATFSGGLSEEYVNSLVEDFGNGLRARLKSHIGLPPGFELPQGSNAITGTYTKEEAERWIAEYQDATRDIPGV